MTNQHNAKARFLLTLLAILLISGAAFYAVSVPRHMGEAAAVGGVLDLTGADFDSLIYPLDGEWEFYFGRFYAPEDFAAGVPDGGTLIHVPSMWNDAGFPAEGFATYRLTVLTEEPMLMLRIPEIPDAGAVRINSEKVFEAGMAGASRESTVSSVRNALVPFAAEGGRAEIILWAANYEWVGGGLSYSVDMGRPGVLQTDVMSRMVWFAVFLGIVLAMCLYHLILFLHRRKEKVYLIFAAMCLVVFARFAMETNGPVQFLLPGGLGKGLTRFYIALLPLHAAALVLFTHAVFRLPVKGFPRRAIYAATLAVPAALSLIMPFNITGVRYTFICLIPMIMAMVSAAGSARRAENVYNGLYLTAIAIFVVWAPLTKLFLGDALFMPGAASNLFLILSQCVMLSQTYADALAKEQFLLADNAALERVNRLKTDLMNTISHEMRTPLAVMSGYTELISRELKKSGADPQTVRDLDAITSEAERLANMVSNMRELTFSRNEPARKAPMPPGGVIEQVARLYRPMLERKETELTVRIEDGLPDVFGSAEEITQVLFNLLSNAGKYAESAAVAVDARRAGDYIEITVSDTGKGIAPDFLPHAFERYQSGESGGTGVGLAVCKEIVENHGGGIALESELGKGTTARIRLPVHKGGDADA